VKPARAASDGGRGWVLLTDAEERSTLAACRALTTAGYSVAAIAGRRPAATHWSRYCRARLEGPDPLVDPLGFVDRLEQLVAERTYAVLIPATDAALLAISEHRSRLDGRTLTGLPPHENVVRSLDKPHLLEEAARAGLPPPATRSCASEDEAVEAARELGFPLGLKPTRSIVQSGSSRRLRTMLVVNGEAELLAALPDYGSPVTLQQLESFRSILSCSGVIANGELLAITAARARRTYPRFAGTFTFAETIRLSPEVLEQMLAFVRATGWQGIFQTDTLETNDGRLALIDFNPRLFSSIALDVAAGANLPAVWCDWLLHRDPPAARARAGFRYRWEEGELRAFADYLRRRRLRPALSVLRPRRRTTHAFLSITDPGPFCLEVLVLTRRAFARALRAATRRERGD